MTPAAQYAAAIDVLDRIIAGQAAEPALQGWARQNRYAGSKDRAAIRDHVFDVLRRMRSCAAAGHGTGGRAMVIGLLRQRNIPLTDVFGAGGYAPPALSDDESIAPQSVENDPASWDLPDAILPMWQADLGDQAYAAAQILRDRAPITLRRNRGRTTISALIAELADDGIVAHGVSHSDTALHVTENARKLRNSDAFKQGKFEFQDLASQQAVSALPIDEHTKVLDYCAGGGGKALAICDRDPALVVAHDVDIRRMTDIPLRAARANANIKIVATQDLASQSAFDIVFCDAPCSGAGTWRRTPEAKWNITPDKVNEYNVLQGDVINRSAQYVAKGGMLVYATCSVFHTENKAVVNAFLSQNQGQWHVEQQHIRLPDRDGDGFYFAHLRRINSP